MEFEQAHSKWILSHLEQRSGERRGRLERGHGHGEKLFVQNIWWPLYGTLDHLHPEYEVLDWRGKPYFADFVWLPGYIKVVFEIKGYGPHVRDMDRKRYCEEHNRETFLKTMGFQVVTFVYDDIAHQPDLCISLLRSLLSRYQTKQRTIGLCDLAEREVILLAFQLVRPIRPKDVEDHLRVNHRTAVRYLRTLCSKRALRPIQSKNSGIVMKYELVKEHLNGLGWW